MKTRIFFFTILLVTSYIFSQDEIGSPKLKPHNDYWGIGYYASGSLGLSNGFTQNSAYPGFGGMIEISYKYSKSDIVLTISENKIGSENESEHFEVIEFSVGPRFNSALGKNNFAELSFGTLMVRAVHKILFTEFSHSYYPVYKTDPEFGVAAVAGIGKEIHINGSTSLMLKLRLLTAYPIKDELFSFISAGTGLSFSTKKTKSSINTEQKPSYWGTTLWGGVSNPDIFEKLSYNWSYNFGFGLNFRLSKKIELLLTGNYNKFVLNEIYEAYRHSMTSITAGGRFFINDSPGAQAFIETGGGLYTHTYQYGGQLTGEYYDQSENFPGINMGSGIKFKITALIDAITRANIHFLFSEPYDYAPDFLTLQGGLRFNL